MKNIRIYVWIEFAIWLLILGLIVGGVRLWRYNQYKELNSYQIFLQDADGLIVGSPVKFMGVQVGYIDMLQIVSNDVYAKFRITDKNISLPEGSVASVEFSGMGGSKSLELYPPTLQSIASGKLIYVERPKRLHDALGLLNEMYVKIDSIAGRLSYFAKEAGMIAGDGAGIDTKHLKENIDMFTKWLGVNKRVLPGHINKEEK